MCTSEPVSLESSAAACAAWRASSEPSVASKILVGKTLTGVPPCFLYPFSRHHDDTSRHLALACRFLDGRRATRLFACSASRYSVRSASIPLGTRCCVRPHRTPRDARPAVHVGGA